MIVKIAGGERETEKLVYSRVSMVSKILLLSVRWPSIAVDLTGSAVITHDVTTGTGYCLVGFKWIIGFLN